MNFTEFCEEWKPFPKDKVNRQIDKKNKGSDARGKHDAHVMKAVKNYKTKSTDFSKSDQKFVGSDSSSNLDRITKHYDDRNKSWDKAAEKHKEANDYEAKKQSKIDKKKKPTSEKKISKWNDKLDSKRKERSNHIESRSIVRM